MGSVWGAAGAQILATGSQNLLMQWLVFAHAAPSGCGGRQTTLGWHERFAPGLHIAPAVLHGCPDSM